MVDLPVPQQQLATTEAPQSRVGGDAFQAPKLNPVTVPLQGRTSIAPGLADVGQGAEAIAVPLAQKQAAADLAKSVTRNPDGSLNVTTPENNFILGQAGQAYSAAVMQGSVAEHQTQMQSDFVTMAKAHVNDPDGFRKDAADYLDKRRANNPGILGQTIFQDGSRLAEQHWAGLVNQKAALDVDNARQSIQTQISDKLNQAQALARQGGTATPEFSKASHDLDALYDSLGTNPLFKISPDKIASEKQRASDLFKGEAIVGEVDATYKRSGPGGGRAAAQKILEDQIVNNPSLNIPEQERNRLYNMGMHRLEYLTGEQKAQVDANRGTVRETLQAIHAGRDLPDQMLDQVVSNAQKLGDAESVAELQAARAIYGIGKAAAQGTPEQQFNAHFPQGAPHPAAAPVPDGVANSTADMIRHFEGFRTTPYWDVNHYRVGYGSDTVTKPDGSVVEVQPGMTVTREDAERDLARRAQEGTTQARSQLGDDAWNRVGAKAQAAMGSVAYNYGKLPGSVVTAAQTGDPQAVAAAIASLPANPARRRQEAASILGYAIPAGSTFQGKTLTMPASANGVPFTPAQVQQNPFLLSEQVRQVAHDDRETLRLAKTIAPGIEEGLRGGLDPDPTTLANFYQLSDKHQKELGEQRQKIDALIQGNAIATTASGMPMGQGQALIDEAKRQAQGASIYQQQAATHAETMFTRQTAALQSDPQREAARRGWIPHAPVALDPANGDAFAQGVMERRTAAAMIGSRLGKAPQGLMFSPADTKGMANFLQASGGDGARNLLNGLVGNLKPEEMDALMQSPDMKAAVSGLTRSGDPAKMSAAYGALDAIYRSGNAETFKKDFGEEALSDLRYWQSHLAFLPPDQLAKEMRRNDDPGVIKARKELEKQADAGPLKGLTPGQVVKKFGGWFTSAGEPASDAPALTAMALKDDYEQAFRMQFGKTGSASEADKFAQENIGQKWGVSGVNNSRVMSYPPERYYPQVGGSHDWLGRQLGEFVARRAGDQGIQIGTAYDEMSDAVRPITVPVTSEQQRASNIALGDHALVPDAQTQAEIANRQAPGYQVVVRASDGAFHLLMDDAGKPVRFKGDPTRPAAEANARFEANRKAIMPALQAIEATKAQALAQP